MSDINIGFAFMQYMLNPCVETVDAVVLALESRPDLPITAEKTRETLLAGIDDMKAAKAGTSTAHTSALMQRLLGGMR
ncbi:MAG: hypothetical protein EOO27_01725 [Comamonadaceae bacterium]|nr:MAG: hypothetical protein EOO27_01725 [Comamonadaceae bacterium]